LAFMRKFAWICLIGLIPMACGESQSGPADSWELAANGIKIVIQKDPYGYTVYNESGQAVLSSLGKGDRDGYGSLAWTTGTINWQTVISPGYYGFEPDLRAWKADFKVEEVIEGESQIETVLIKGNPEPGSPRVRVVHKLRPSVLRVEASYEGDPPRAWAAAFESPATEAFLGFGERFNRTNQRGVNVYSWLEEGGIGGGEAEPIGPENPYPNGEAMAYYPVPFFISTAGYGFWLDSTWRNEFNLASDHDDAWQVWHIGPQLAYEVYVAFPNDSRPWPYHLIDSFTGVTGRPMIPPKWTFGPRRRINRGDMQAGVHEIQAMRDLDLAITGIDDAVHFLPKGSHIGREAELAAWTAMARGLGYRVNCYFNAYLNSDEANPLRAEVLQGLENDWFLKDSDGNPSEVWMVSGSMMRMYMVDYTIPEAVSWYQSMLQWAIDLGYSGWMYDFGEYVQPNTIAGNGMTGEEYHNLYTVQYQKAAHDYLESGAMAGEWLTFVRSGYTGASAYSPMIWGGDPAASFEEADGLPSMVRAGVNLGISGAPHWGGDINGFHGVADGYEAADEELLIRWIQQGSMGSNMQDQDAMTGVISGEGRKANIFDDLGARQAWKTYARLHTRLFPYLYSLAHQAHASGEPLMRQPFLENPDRPDLADVDDAYYLGPGLFVAPVVDRGQLTKVVDLPAGLYLDWADQELVDGGQVVTLDAPLDKLPLLLRDGYLIPMLDPTIDTLADEDHPDVIGRADVSHVYDVVGLLSTGKEATFRLYDDGLLEAAWTGGFSPPEYPQALNEDELSDCLGCYLTEQIDSGLTRVRITSPGGAVNGGGLALTAQVGRTVRWDLYLVD